MSMATPVIVPFKTVDANEYFYIEYVGDSDSDKDNRFKYWRFIVTNLDTGTQIVSGGADISGTSESDIDKHFNNVFVTQNRTTSAGYWSSIDKNYYFGFPKNFVRNGETVFENGYRYSIEIDFGITSASGKDVMTTPYPFSCYSNFTIALESYQYNNGEDIKIEQTNLLTPYKLTIVQPVCKLKFSYTQENGEALQYHQFFLYNQQGRLLGATQKIYGVPNEGIVYTMENCNNLQNYTLKLYCVTQTHRSSTTTVNIYTDYNTDSIYADISFLYDNQNAENIISFNVIQLNGVGEEPYGYDNENECVIIEDNGYVSFTDSYQTISQNFLCRLWCKDLSINIPIFKIQTLKSEGYIEVYFTGVDFRAYKYSCGLKSMYYKKIIKTANNTETTFVTDVSELQGKEIYFSIGYYDGRLEMYAQIIESEVAV